MSTESHWADAVGGTAPRLELSYADDPCVVKQQEVEEYTNHVVPFTARLGRGSIMASWSSVASAMAFVYYGALAATLVGIAQALIGIAVTCVVYAVIAGVGAAQAIQTGLNSTLMSRELFGLKGAAICPLIIALGTAFYAVFESSVLATALQTFVGHGDIRIWYVVVAVCMLPLMLGGMQTWLGKLNGISLPIYFFGLIAAVIVAGIRFGWDGQWSVFDAAPSTTGVPGWVTVVVFYMGVWLVFPEIQDSARMGKPEDKAFHLNISFGVVYWIVAYMFNALVGIAIVGLVFGQPGVEPTEIGAVQGVIASLGVVGLIVIVVSQVRINSANFYFFSTSAERFVSHFTSRNLSRRIWVVVSAVVVLIVMFTNIFSYLTTALAWLGVLIAAWIAMQLVGWAMNRGKQIEFRPQRVKNVAPGFYLWAFATVFGVVLLEMPERQPVLSALAPLVTFVIAAAGYAIMVAAKASALRGARRDSVRERIDDLWATRVKCGACDLSYVAVEMDVSKDETEALCLHCQV
jgi:purine-cytosine permease-like protein